LPRQNISKRGVQHCVCPFAFLTTTPDDHGAANREVNGMMARQPLSLIWSRTVLFEKQLAEWVAENLKNWQRNVANPINTQAFDQSGCLPHCRHRQ
jgi:hypothetical protein